MALLENMGAVEMPPHPPPDAGVPRRRRADKEHDLFATIVEDAFSEIIVFDAETLAIILANKSARNNLGYASTEITGLSINDLKTEFCDRLRQAAATGTGECRQRQPGCSTCARSRGRE